MDKIFEPILDKNEKIVEVFKPNKAKVFLSSFISSFLFLLFMFAIACLAIFVPEENVEPINPLWILLPVGILLFIEAIVMIFTAMYYKKTYFAYSNKRVIVRTGIIGVDYKSLDIKMIGAFDVNVSFIDKLVHKNTGSIRFGSMSSPVTNQAGGIVFASVTNPYENYKKIKEYVEEQRN